MQKYNIPEGNKIPSIEELHRHALCSILKNNRIAFEDAEDIAQDALLVYLQNQLKIENPKAYINRVCQNKVADKFRADARFIGHIEELPAEIYLPESDTPENIIESEIVIEDILKILPKKYHELFLQYKDAGYSQKDLAKQLNVNYNTLKSRIYTLNTYIRSYYLIHEGYGYSFNIFNRHQKNNLDCYISKITEACRNNDPAPLLAYNYDSDKKEINYDLGFFDVSQIERFKYHCENKSTNVFKISLIIKTKDGKFSAICFSIRFEGNNLIIVKPPKEAKTMYLLSPKAQEILNKEFPFHEIKMKDGGRKIKLSNAFKERVKELLELYPSENTEIADHIRPGKKPKEHK